MNYYLLISFALLITLNSTAQTGDSITRKLTLFNNAVAARPCGDESPVITHRAMNVFLADKTGYLSHYTDLSYYTNYITLNTADSKFTVNHNFHTASGKDEPVKKLFSAGVSVNLANGFAQTLLNKTPDNTLGITLSYKWLGEVKTRLDCTPSNNKLNQQQSMDAYRVALLQQLAAEIETKEADFLETLVAIDTTASREEKIPQAKELVKQHFYDMLEDEYDEKFAKMQASLLSREQHFESIRTQWTNVTCYIPVISPKYMTAASLTSPFDEKHPYPLHLLVSHNRLWENSRFGRLFVTITGKCQSNNSVVSYATKEITIREYIDLGGTDTLQLAELSTDKAYVGNYRFYITPSAEARVVYFPRSSHVGVSILLEQNFGSYNLMNGRLAIPIVLINAKKLPAVNVECYMMFLDMTNKLKNLGRNGNKNILGVSIGIPVSRLIY